MNIYSYANDETYFYNKSGRVYAKEINENTEEVESINRTVTAIAPEKKTDIDFCLYAGTDTSGRPACASNISRDLSLDKIGPEFWDPWLWFCVYSKSFKDSIECSTHEIYDIKELSFKFNEKQIIKKY
ncbi:hypothetical protein [Zunongwangia sp.]|uniref:hypothetical protein n=1 Tax=Zunongwangia sp. TaxID=1965325 RepID=UPI003AA91FE4